MDNGAMFGSPLVRDQLRDIQLLGHCNLLVTVTRRLTEKLRSRRDHT